LENSFLGRVDEILDLGAQGFHPPGKTAVDRRDIIETDEKYDGNWNEPDTVKAISHGEDYKTKQKREIKQPLIKERAAAI
jgi:hypothetical protein